MSSENKSSIISQIYKSRNTLLEQFDLMGFNIIQNMECSVNEVNAMYKNKQLDMLLEKKLLSEQDSLDSAPIPSIKAYIHFYINKTLRPANILEIVEELYNVEEVLTKKDILYIILKDEPHDTLINSIKQIWDELGIFIILQNIKRLQFNVLNHTLVPKHRILDSKNEITMLKKKYNIMNNSQLPEISRFDPVSQVICARPGDIIEIIRPSKTAIETKYYRFCI